MTVQPARRVRPSSEEIDRGILDAAAEIFARHGFAGTAVQQVADAVGYSKAGLLRRFASKQTLYDAVLAAAVREGEAVVEAAEQVPPGPGRRQALLDLVTEAALASPGLASLLLESIRPASDLPGRARVEELVTALLESLAADAPSAREQVRALLALQLVVNAASLLTAQPHGPRLAPEELRALVVELSGAVLSPAPR
ncbi:TetR/AcrR family transcriptional regulator [Quadrisphaera sp. DSM 44207]|uniref:TetR/AcrR family transcriptional regulator n=1 Tax=Quadrisphaera sp. DSM 44207 TaxID=1881057 RepID=UPI001C40A9AC|nr:TetR/AcrR family transcriptional regulator [Quadrisphaera sp. DSM 44207]